MKLSILNKTNTRKALKILFTITDACIERAVLEIFLENKTKESVVGTLCMNSSSSLLMHKICFFRILSTNLFVIICRLSAPTKVFLTLEHHNELLLYL